MKKIILCAVHMPQVEEDRADDGNGDDENDDFFSQPIGQTETSNQLTRMSSCDACNALQRRIIMSYIMSIIELGNR